MNSTKLFNGRGKDHFGGLFSNRYVFAEHKSHLIGLVLIISMLLCAIKFMEQKNNGLV